MFTWGQNWYLYFQEAYSHQIWRSGGLWQEATTNKNRMSLWSSIHVRSPNKWKAMYLYTHDTNINKTWQGVASHIVMRHFDQMIMWNHVTTKNVRSVSIKPMVTKRGQGGGLQQRTTNGKVTWPFSHVVRSRNKLK